MSVHVFYVAPVLVTAFVIAFLPVGSRHGNLYLSSAWRLTLSILMFGFIVVFIADEFFEFFRSALGIESRSTYFYLAAALMLSNYIRVHGGYEPRIGFKRAPPVEEDANKKLQPTADAPAE